MWIGRLFIPVRGVRLAFQSLSLTEKTRGKLLLIQRVRRNQEPLVQWLHIVKDMYADAFKKIDGVDFEIVVYRNSRGAFNLDYAHVFIFLLMIKNGGWVSAPALLTESIMGPPERQGANVYCQHFIEETPYEYLDKKLSVKDGDWIKDHLHTAITFTKDPRFQNAMQALNSFHCIPYANTCLVTAWSGLEALFKTDQEISFRLSLYVSNYLRRGKYREIEFKKLRNSYSVRSKITHGNSTSAKDIRDQALYTRDILRECLRKCIEESRFPHPSDLVFS